MHIVWIIVSIWSEVNIHCCLSMLNMRQSCIWISVYVPGNYTEDVHWLYHTEQSGSIWHKVITKLYCLVTEACLNNTAGNNRFESIWWANRKPTGFDSAVVTSSGRFTLHSIHSSDHERKLRKMLNEMLFYFRTYVTVHLQLIAKK